MPHVGIPSTGRTSGAGWAFRSIYDPTGFIKHQAMNAPEVLKETRHGGRKPVSAPDSPGVIIFPPLLYVGTLLLGLSLHWLWPLHVTKTRWGWIVGAVIAVMSIILGGWASITMQRGGTNIIPSKPALAIVSDGPFRFTRNPIYVANANVYLALALIFNTLWPFLLFVPMLLVLDWGIIRREERYLEAKFGDAYLTYKARVRRWL